MDQSDTTNPGFAVLRLPPLDLGRVRHVVRRFGTARNAGEILQVITDNAFDGLNPSCALIAGVCANDQVEILADCNMPPEVVGLSPIPIDIGFPLTEAILSRTPIWIESAADRKRWYPDLDRFDEVPPSAGLVPLEIDDRAIGGLGLFFPRDHVFNERARQHYELLADLAAFAVDRLAR